MIAQLLSPASLHPAVTLRKPAYLTAPDIVVVVVGGLGNSKRVGVERGMRGGDGKVWIEEKETERNPRGKVLASTTKSPLLLELPQRDADVSGIAWLNL